MLPLEWGFKRTPQIQNVLEVTVERGSECSQMPKGHCPGGDQKYAWRCPHAEAAGLIAYGG